MSDIKILFAGDFTPCRGYENLILNKGSKVFRAALPFILDSDISFVNLESPLTKRTRQISKSGPALKASSECAAALSCFSVAGLANNHCLDYGILGLKDTLDACEKNGVDTIGAGLNFNDANQVYTRKIQETRISILAFAEREFNKDKNGGGAAVIDPIKNYYEIIKARSKSDITIVTLHAGNEYFPYPRPGLRELCHFYVSLGADAVICHHPHVPGAYEYYQGRPIIYSLGNFIFDGGKTIPDWDLGYMAQLLIDVKEKKIKSLCLVPYRQSIKLGGLSLLTGEEKEVFLEKIEKYRKNLENEEAWMKEWQAFVARNSDRYILRNYLPFNFRGLGFLGRHTPLSKLLLNRKNSNSKLNMIRCDSHLELLQSSLVHKRCDAECGGNVD